MMKYFIVGMHGSGKQEIGHILRKMDVSVGRIFTNLDDRNHNIYNVEEYELFDTQTVNEMFENNSYMFIKELETEDGLISYKTYEGLSTWEYDQNQVHIFSPDQLLAIPQTKLAGENICYVWLDNNRDQRLTYYIHNQSTYSFALREEVEGLDMDSFVKRIYTNTYDSSAGPRVLYFNNEVPERIATIIYSCIKYPDLLNIFIENYS